MQEQRKKRFFVIAGSLFVIVVLAVILNSTNTETNIKDLFFEWILFTGMYGVCYYLFFIEKNLFMKNQGIKSIFLASPVCNCILEYGMSGSKYG